MHRVHVPCALTAPGRYHALKDTLAGAAVFTLLLAFALLFRAPLDPIADPSVGAELYAEAS